MHDPTPAVPFHHLAVRLDRAPLQMGWKSDGHQLNTDLPLDHVSIIPAGASITSWWNRPVDFACLYFTAEAVEAAVGQEVLAPSQWTLEPALALQAPAMCSLIRLLARDTHLGQPFGSMRGEALFHQLATLLAVDARVLKDTRYKIGIGDRRIRRALDYIHAHICADLDLHRIAHASETSPFHLSRLFRHATGYPVWRYVSRLRTQLAVGLMNDALLSLSEIATLSGFTSYSTFAATFTAEHGLSPAHFRKSHRAIG